MVSIIYAAMPCQQRDGQDQLHVMESHRAVAVAEGLEHGDLLALGVHQPGVSW
jgi:hypothetical protein